MKRKLLSIKPSVLAYEPEYQAVLDYATANVITTPDSAQNDINNNIIKNMKTEGIWNWDLFYYFQQPSGLADFTCINWANPGNYNCVQVSSPSFVAGSGFKNNSGSGYLDTEWIASTDAIECSLTDLCIFWECFDIPSTFAGVSEIIGGRTGASDQLMIRNNTNNGINHRMFGSLGDSSIGQSYMNALFQLNVTGGRRYRDCIDASFDADEAYTMSNLTAVKLFLIGFNNNGSLLIQEDTGIKFFGLGANANGKQTELQNIMHGTY